MLTEACWMEMEKPSRQIINPDEGQAVVPELVRTPPTRSPRRNPDNVSPVGTDQSEGNVIRGRPSQCYCSQIGRRRRRDGGLNPLALALRSGRGRRSPESSPHRAKGLPGGGLRIRQLSTGRALRACRSLAAR